MTRKIKNLLLAALFAVSPFAPLAQAQTQTETGTDVSAVQVLTNRSLGLRASDINFGVIDQGVVSARAESIELNCITHKGNIVYSGSGGGVGFDETDGQCGEIVVESGAEELHYRLIVDVTANPATESSSDGVKDTVASLTVYPQGPQIGGGLATPIIQKAQRASSKQSPPQTTAANTEEKFDIGGNLTIGRQASGQYVGSYTVELVVCNNPRCDPN